ncbi:MAG: ABC transporter transmembrane domain-containing protein, partial [Vagococcus fluvialis]
MNRNFSLENLKLFFPYLKNFKKEIIFASFLGIINGVSVVTLTYYIGKAVDTMIGQGKVILPELIKIIFFLSLITVIASISQWLIQILGNKIAYYSVRNLRKSAFNHLNQLSINYYDRTSHGDLMSRFSNDLDYVSEACSAIFNQLFSGVTIVLISLFSMIWLSPLLTVIVLISTFFIFLVNWIVATRSQKQFGKQQKQLGEIAG